MSSAKSARLAGPEAVVGDFTTAWNTHDMKAYDRLFTDDAVWIAVAESRVNGRGKIVEDFRDIHSSWAAKTTVVASAIEVHPVRPDVAVVLFHTGYLDEQGQALPGVDRAVITVVVQDAGNWKIAVPPTTQAVNLVTSLPSRGCGPTPPHPPGRTSVRSAGRLGSGRCSLHESRRQAQVSERPCG